MEKLVVVPEPIDSDFFDPAKAAPLPLPQGELVFGAPPPLDAEPDFAFVSVCLSLGSLSPVPSSDRDYISCGSAAGYKQPDDMSRRTDAHYGSRGHLRPHCKWSTRSC